MRGLHRIAPRPLDADTAHYNFKHGAPTLVQKGDLILGCRCGVDFSPTAS
jgi:hypothetical protein